jgi:hypothetical protein
MSGLDAAIRSRWRGNGNQDCFPVVNPQSERISMDNNQPEIGTDAKTRAFLAELTQLSVKYRIGIGGESMLYKMEWEDDARVYSEDGDGNLRFE